MLCVEAQTEPLEAISFKRSHAIRAADVVPQLKQERGNPAHSASGHADQMNAMPLLREAFLQVSFGRERHGVCVYLSIVSTTSPAAFFGARRPQFSDMRCNLLGSAINS